jgi:hypothetical protein
MNRSFSSAWGNFLLIVIALLLAVIALRPIFQPQPVLAQGTLGGVQFTFSQGYYTFFDGRTGDLWQYNPYGQLSQHYKMTKLGDPLLQALK